MSKKKLAKNTDEFDHPHPNLSSPLAPPKAGSPPIGGCVAIHITTIFTVLSFRSRIKSGMTDPESSVFSERYAAGCRIGPVLNLIGDPA